MALRGTSADSAKDCERSRNCTATSLAGAPVKDRPFLLMTLPSGLTILRSTDAAASCSFGLILSGAGRDRP